MNELHKPLWTKNLAASRAGNRISLVLFVLLILALFEIASQSWRIDRYRDACNSIHAVAAAFNIAPDTIAGFLSPLAALHTATADCTTAGS